MFSFYEVHSIVKKLIWFCIYISYKSSEILLRWPFHVGKFIWTRQTGIDGFWEKDKEDILYEGDSTTARGMVHQVLFDVIHFPLGPLWWHSVARNHIMARCDSEDYLWSFFGVGRVLFGLCWTKTFLLLGPTGSAWGASESPRCFFCEWRVCRISRKEEGWMEMEG